MRKIQKSEQQGGPLESGSCGQNMMCVSCQRLLVKGSYERGYTKGYKW